MLVLASASPRRHALLTQAGFSFRVEPADIAEEQQPLEDPVAFVLRLSREKAETVFGRQEPGEPGELLVLGADTVVVAPDGSTLGKPADAADAARMLRLLAGGTHQVITGVCVRSAARTEVAAEVTWVTLRALGNEEIDTYIALGEPEGKAGAYAIQGYAARWVLRIHGSYDNVVGLPLALVTAMLEAAGCTC